MITITKEDLIQMILDSYPHFSIWANLIEKKLACFYSQNLQWQYTNLTKLENNELVDLYFQCKNSWEGIVL